MTTPSVSLTHIVRKPVVPSEGPPLLVLLHGVGSNEEDLFGLADHLDERFFVASVRAPLTLGPGAFGWYRIAYGPDGFIYDKDEAARGREAVARVIGELVDAYGLDAGRVYLAGFSQGAIMSLGVALKYPAKIAGAVLMSGRLLPEFAGQSATGDRLAHLKVFIAHGRWDDVIPVEDGRAIRDFLAPLPLASEYREYPMGHNVTQESLADIAAWLTARLDGE
jgi:phospholipase/carboxylesterase